MVQFLHYPGIVVRFVRFSTVTAEFYDETFIPRSMDTREREKFLSSFHAGERKQRDNEFFSSGLLRA